MMASERQFCSVFADKAISPDQLRRAYGEIWYDGAALIFQGWSSRRYDIHHEWPDQEDGTLRIVECASRAKAVRLAVALFDEFAKLNLAEHTTESGGG